MTVKLSHAQIQAVLKEAPEALRKVASERDFWKEKALSMMQADEISKTASDIMSRGLHNDVDRETLIEGLTKAASAGKLGSIQESLHWVGPDMGQKIASLGDRAGNNGVSAMDRLQAAIVE